MPLSIMEIEHELRIIVEAWGLPLRRPKPLNPWDRTPHLARDGYLEVRIMST